MKIFLGSMPRWSQVNSLRLTMEFNLSLEKSRNSVLLESVNPVLKFEVLFCGFLRYSLPMTSNIGLNSANAIGRS